MGRIFVVGHDWDFCWLISREWAGRAGAGSSNIGIGDPVACGLEFTAIH